MLVKHIYSYKYSYNSKMELFNVVVEKQINYPNFLEISISLYYNKDKTFHLFSSLTLEEGNFTAFTLTISPNL